MKTRMYDTAVSEKGFTLVELAVVMVIIGLLIGGILKGQEMIANAQVNSTIAQIRAVDAATSTFRDIYDAFPGDMLNPQARLPNCTAAPCNVAGDGDSRLEVLPLGTAGTEETGFFEHLEAADLLAGINNASFLDADINGNEMRPGFTTGAAALGALANPLQGHYISIVQSGTDAAPGLESIDAARIDRKLDDGDPATGSVGGNAATCGTGGAYLEANPGLICASIVRIQG